MQLSASYFSSSHATYFKDEQPSSASGQRMTQLEVPPDPAQLRESFSANRRRWSLRFDPHPLLTTAILFTLFAVLFAFIQFGTPSLADNDGFYHMRMGALLQQAKDGPGLKEVFRDKYAVIFAVAD
jgi:hypothetical protein